MSDPLSMSAGIAGLLSLAQMVIKEGYGYIRTAKGCPDELSELCDEDAFGLSGIRKTLNDILKLLGKFRTREGKSVQNIGKKMLWPFKADDVKDMLSNINRHKATLQLALSTDTRAQVKEVRYDQCRAEQERRDEQKNTHGMEVLELLSSALDHEARHEDIREKRQDNTGNWVFETEQFKRWLQGSDSLLWCHGIQFCSVLRHPDADCMALISSIIIDHLKLRFLNDNVGIAFLYCNYKDNRTQTPKDMLASLLKQLLIHRNQTDSAVDTLFEECVLKRIKPTLPQLQKIINSVSQNFDQVYIIFDAMNECDEVTQRTDILSFIEQASHHPFKILATSHPHPADIQNSFTTALRMEIFAHESDLEVVIRNKIAAKRARKVTVSSELENDVVTTLLRKAEGMFLLFNFQIDHILRQPTPKKKRQALYTIPKDLNATYEMAVERILRLEDAQRQLALDTLTWIVFALRPLRFSELQVFVAIEDGDSELDPESLAELSTIVDICASLIVLEEETQVIRLAHYTVQTYLESLPMMGNAHRNLAWTCLNYLSFDEFSRLTEKQSAYRSEFFSNSQFRYATENWGHHIRLHGNGNLHLPLLLRSLKFVHHAYLASLLRYSKTNLKQWMAHLFQFCCYYGLYGAVEKLLEDGYKKYNSTEQDLEIPLLIAASQGHHAVLKILLEQRNVQVNCRDMQGRSALHMANKNGHEVSVKLLLKRDDVDINARDRFLRTPLFSAATIGSETEVQLLLGRDDVDINSRDRSRQTPLFTAAVHGHEAVVKLLLERDDVDINSRDRLRQTPLFTAAVHGHEAVMKLLLERDDVEVNSSDRLRQTPLGAAAQNGHEAVVKQLLKRDHVDVNARDFWGQSPLMRAVSRGNEAMVHLLLARGDINVECPNRLEKRHFQSRWRKDTL
ncbi:hypothetical protein K440DRAFT_660797 [Wilcoxina mikolae CBS 423.85]|nr:hypothetical protein K440DRAFT_660797 [Wilcoxina mikolae CBS 423.85]